MDEGANAAEILVNDSCPTVEIIVFAINYKAYFARKDYNKYKKQLEKPVTWRDRLLTKIDTPKFSDRRCLEARWLIVDQSIFGDEAKTEDALVGTENLVRIAGDDGAPWTGMSMILPGNPIRKIQSTIMLPQFIFDEVCACLSNFPNAALEMRIKVELNNSDTPNPLLPKNWFKVNGQKEEAQHVTMRIEDVEIIPPFEHAHIIEHFEQLSS